MLGGWDYAMLDFIGSFFLSTTIGCMGISTSDLKEGIQVNYCGATMTLAMMHGCTFSLEFSDYLVQRNTE